MRRNERRGLRQTPDMVEESRDIARKSSEIVGNFIASKQWPETIPARELVALLRVTQLFPEKMKRSEYIGILSAILPDFGYSDAIFRRREFRKMPSKHYH